MAQARHPCGASDLPERRWRPAGPPLRTLSRRRRLFLRLLRLRIRFWCRGVRLSGQRPTIFEWQRPTYYINGVAKTSAEQMVTLGSAHATLDRIDVIAVNAAGAVEVVAGTAAAQASEPDVDPSLQLKLGVVLVTAASTAPVGASVTNLWLEQAGTPTEWAWTSSGTGWTIGSTSNPRTGSKCIEGTNVAKSAYAQAALAASVFVDPNDYDSLVLYVKSKAAWQANRALKLQWHASGVAKGAGVILQSGVFGFDSAVTANYQLVVIPITQFAVSFGTPCNQLRITDTNGAIGFFIDDMSSAAGHPQ